MSALDQNWRWLCVECDTEDFGEIPEKCPTCGRTDAWYANNCKVDDTRSMREIMSNDIFGHLRKKN